MRTHVYASEIAALNPCADFQTTEENYLLAWGSDPATLETILNPPNIDQVPGQRGPTPVEGFWVLVNLMSDLERCELLERVLSRYVSPKNQSMVTALIDVCHKIHAGTMTTPDEDDVRAEFETSKGANQTDENREALHLSCAKVELVEKPMNVAVCSVVRLLTEFDMDIDDCIATALAVLKGE